MYTGRYPPEFPAPRDRLYNVGRLPLANHCSAGQSQAPGSADTMPVVPEKVAGRDAEEVA